MPRRKGVLGVKPAGPDHEVVSVEGKAGDYQRRPCATCPWRLDAVGEFPAEAFRHSAHTCYDVSMHTFACHTAGIENSKTCAGFILSHSADHNMALRVASFEGNIDRNQVTDGGHALFTSYTEMAVANGVGEDEEVLRPCR